MAAVIHIVDDDDAVRDSLRALLESFGMAVEDYSSALAFLARTCVCGRACLIVDMHMPGMNGLELLEYLKNQGKVLPAIAITGRCDPGLRERLRDAGASAVLEKPVDDEELRHLIEAVTETRPAAQ